MPANAEKEMNGQLIIGDQTVQCPLCGHERFSRGVGFISPQSFAGSEMLTCEQCGHILWLRTSFSPRWPEPIVNNGFTSFVLSVAQLITFLGCIAAIIWTIAVYLRLQDLRNKEQAPIGLFWPTQKSPQGGFRDDKLSIDERNRIFEMQTLALLYGAVGWFLNASFFIVIGRAKSLGERPENEKYDDYGRRNQRCPPRWTDVGRQPRD